MSKVALSALDVPGLPDCRLCKMTCRNHSGRGQGNAQRCCIAGIFEGLGEQRFMACGGLADRPVGPRWRVHAKDLEMLSNRLTS